MKYKKIISKILSDISKEVLLLSDEEFDGLLNDEYRFKLVLNNKVIGKSKPVVKKDYLSLETKLGECRNRDEGFVLLTQELKTRKELEMFAKEIGIYIMKTDKVDKIREKIIEGTIGALLRSTAIQKNEK
ncbi:hypothetical protein J7S95_18660 [Providencia stuartii]|uniref:hypothetical protein n=1 Tax=Morganellaceae TaxID=1903414 RepID=UPI0018C5638E|nr:hypothetical protein [Providencia stuartii]EKW2645861.1 hypothetical protein [Proteus mirabilis]MBG3020929.1 hypothetical protein [Proteus mirabilis]MBQ0458722.1 hypothetical protein [Providencia stuartii]